MVYRIAMPCSEATTMPSRRAKTFLRGCAIATTWQVVRKRQDVAGAHRLRVAEDRSQQRGRRRGDSRSMILRSPREKRFLDFPAHECARLAVGELLERLIIICRRNCASRSFYGAGRMSPSKWLRHWDERSGCRSRVFQQDNSARKLAGSVTKKHG